MKITEVAVAVFLKPDGTFLLSSRPEGKPYAGYWEFPGGKIELGESIRDALVRELIEELNVTITRTTPWFTFMMHYTHATVRLHCWRVTAWQGEMRGMERQQFAWQQLNANHELTVTPTLPGCVPIFKALALPLIYGRADPGEMSTESYLQHLRLSWSHNASNASPVLEFESSNNKPMIQLHANNLSAVMGAAHAVFVERVQKLAHEAGIKMLIGGDISLAKNIGADGVQLNATQLYSLTERPDFALVGATVSTREELLLAAKWQCDFAVMELADTSHFNWPAFAELIQATPLPCYASGALTTNDLAIAITHGAHGIVIAQ